MARGKIPKQNPKSRNQDRKNQDGKNISNLSSMISLDRYKVFVLIIGKLVFLTMILQQFLM